MQNTFLESTNLILEPLEEKHLSSQYISWLNDEEVTKYNSHGIFPNSIDKTKQYIKSIQFTNSSIVLAMIEKQTNNHIGNVSIQSIDFINSNADLAILIGDKKSWGKLYAFEAFMLLINHCFNKLNLHKVTAGTTSDNIPMQKVINKLNMEKEAILKDAIKRDNKYFDIYLYGLLNEN
ncbi:MAG: GNAT family N-acetyltransferase [Arcobacteraceae bacterium]|nr:GNAT family N-acetyltransferase [Arcobacteraceae bacterium]